MIAMDSPHFGHPSLHFFTMGNTRSHIFVSAPTPGTLDGPVVHPKETEHS